MKPRGPSRTAIVVAKSQALAGRSPEHCGLVAPATLSFVQHALERAGCGRFVACLGGPWFRGILRRCESLMIPGLVLHHVLRKRMVEAFARRHLGEGARQLVQIGAGFDALAFRLHREFPSVHFIEFDHPDTQRAKRDVVSALGGAAPNLELLPLDLAEVDGLRWPEGWNPNLPSAVIIEGVMMYLEPETVSQLLLRAATNLHPDSRLLFSFMDRAGFHRQSPAVNWWLRLAGEPFRSTIPLAELDGVLKKASLKCCDLRATRQLADELFPNGLGNRPLQVADGELLCVAGAKPRPNGRVECGGQMGAFVDDARANGLGVMPRFLLHGGGKALDCRQ